MTETVFGHLRLIIIDCHDFISPFSPKGGFPLSVSRNFYVRTDVNFNWLYVRK